MLNMNKRQTPFSTTPLVSSSNLHLLIDDPDVDLETVSRFVDVFRSTWRDIPLSARRRILQFFRNHPLNHDLYSFPIPTVLIRDQIDRNDPYAQCDYRFARLAFRRHAIEEFSTEGLRTLIAHELAHVYLATIDSDNMYDQSGYQEDQVDTLLEDEWGFDLGALGDSKMRHHGFYVDRTTGKVKRSRIQYFRAFRIKKVDRLECATGYGTKAEAVGIANVLAQSLRFLRLRPLAVRVVRRKSIAGHYDWYLQTDEK